MARLRKIRWLLVVGLVAMLWLAWAWYVPAGGFRRPRLVGIAPHASTIQIARQLRRAQVVHSELGFLLWRAWHLHASLQAGTYRFQAPRRLGQVFQKLEQGRVFVYAFTVPEGYDRFAIAHALADDGLAATASFLRATASGRLVRDLDPGAPNLEGYLFPATYPIAPHTPARAIAGMMVARFRAMLRHHGWPPKFPISQGPGSLHAWVTIASLVEKETARARERGLIAGVFYNRLRLGLPLQCDPTVIYAAELAHRYSGVITRRDLRLNSPYNTYLHAGLPPGPIANPGLAALRAALHPHSSKFLYFVSNGDGGHRFARTLAQQDVNLRKYLRMRARRH
jgi:UPF0755 protein